MSKISYHLSLNSQHVHKQNIGLKLYIVVSWPKEPIHWPSLVSSRHDQSQADLVCDFSAWLRPA